MDTLFGKLIISFEQANNGTYSNPGTWVLAWVNPTPVLIYFTSWFPLTNPDDRFTEIRSLLGLNTV